MVVYGLVGFGGNGELGNSSTSNLVIPENISTDYIHTDKTKVVIKGINGTDKINASYMCGFNLYDYSKSDNMEFASLDENIVTVDNSGNLTAVGIGKTYVTIKAEGLARRVQVDVIKDTENAVMDLQSGNKHTVGLKTNGTLWSFGANNFGQLGNGTIDTNTVSEPKEITGVPNGETFTAIAVGGEHTIALSKSGKVYTFGASGKGQLGNGSTADNPSLVEISGLSNIQKIYAYQNKSFALTNAGELYAWGEGFGLIPQKLNFFSGIIDITRGYILSEYGTIWSIDDLSQKVPGMKNIVDIAGGADHLIALDIDGKIYGMGGNTYGQVGINGVSSVTDMTEILGADGQPIKGVVEVIAGDYNSYLRLQNGDIYSFGKNNNGSLGLGDTGNISIPTKIDFSNAEVISAGLNNSFAVQSDGTAYSWGANGYGQLGLKDKQDRNIPTQIGRTKIELEKQEATIKVGENLEIKASLNNTFNLRTDVIRTTGFEYKALDKNVVSLNNSIVTGTKEGLTTVIVKDNETKETGNVYIEVLNPDYNSVVDVVSGTDYSVALRYDGSLWAWGQNTEGQLADGSFENKLEPVEITGSTSRIKQIAVGNAHTLVLLENGEVLASGLNDNGQVGMGSTVNQKALTNVMDENGNKLTNIVRISAKGNTSYALDKDGNIYVFGEGAYKAATVIEGINNISDISGKYGITADGKVIDLVTTKELEGLSNIVKVAEGANHTLFLNEDGKVYAYGQNGNGQCGIGTKINCIVPTIVKNSVGIDDLSNIIDIAAGDNYSVAVDKDGNLYTWGQNNNYCIGKESLGDQLLPKKNSYIKDVMQVAAGTRTVIVAKKDGSVWAFGNNEIGQLGNGITENTYIPVQVGEDEIYVETNHLTIAEFDTFELKGGIKAFNLIKDVSVGGVSYVSNDTGVAIVNKTGKVTGVNEGIGTIVVKENGGDRKAIVQVNTIRTGSTVKPSVITADSHQVILKADGTVWTYGDNTYGELGDGTKVSRDSLEKVTFADGVKIKEIAAGDSHVLALDLDGNVWVWGRNNDNQLGLANTTEAILPTKLELGQRIVKVAAGYNQSFAITDDNKLIAWGLNENGELGIGTNDEKAEPTMIKNVKNVLDIAVGRTHSILVTTNGEVYTTGNNSYGSLSGTVSKRNRFAKVENLEDIAYISSGEYHNMVLDINGKVYVWGGNKNGQLGNGNTNTINIPFEITGITNKKEIAAGKDTSFIRTKDGEIYAAGANVCGQLGSGDNNSKQEFEKINTINDVFEISAGNTYAMAITKDGTVWAWGDYYHGVSANRTETNSNVPVKVGNDRFLVKNRDMVIPKQANKDIEIQNANSFNVWDDKNISSNYTFTSIDESIATVDANGTVTGKDIGTTWVKVKNNNTNETQIAIIKVVEEGNVTSPKVRGGQEFALTIKADGSLHGFGYNSFGELGLGTYVGKDIPTSVDSIKTYTDLATGYDFTLTLRNDGTVWSFGRNQNGELGLGHRENRNIPTQIESLSNIIKVSAGRRHAVALDSYGDVYIWGSNSLGQLGLNGKSSVDIPTKLSLGDVEVIDIAAGQNLTAIVLSDGKLLVFGEGAENLNYTKVGNAVKAQIGNEIIVLTTGGNVTKVGNTLSTIYNQKDAVDIAAKADNYMILTKGGESYNFGANTNGELGLGNNSAVTVPTKVDFDERIIDIGVGTGNSYIISKTGLVYASGINTYGSIGNETKINTNKYVLVGEQNFELNPDNLLMTVGDEEDIVNITVTSERFNVFRTDERNITDFEWISNDDTIAEVVDAATIKAIAEGETTLTVKCKETGKEVEVIVVVVPVDKDRIEKLQVNDTDAKVTAAMKYKVEVETDEDTGKLVISTKDKTDKISIDGGQSWFENGELEHIVQLPDKENIFNILVQVTNGEQVEYELTVVKQSANVDLLELKVNDEPATSTGSQKYIAICDEDNAVVYAKTENENAKVSIDGEESKVHEASKTFDMTNSLIKIVPIKVTSESGKEMEYTLTVYKNSALMDLEKLTVNGVDATKNSLLEYSIVIPRDTTSAEIYIKTLYELAGVNINNLGEEIRETTKTIQITGESTKVKIKVSVEGVDREYTLTINKELDPTALAFVYVNGAEIKPNGNKYEVYIGKTDVAAEVQAIAAVNTSIVQIGANDAEIGQTTKTVSIDSDSVTYIIKVTDAEDPDNSNEYELIIRRPSADNTLKQITVQNESFSKNAQRIEGTNKYVVSIDKTCKDFKIIAETNYNLSKVKIEDNNFVENIDTYEVTGYEYTDGKVFNITVKPQEGDEAGYELIVKYISDNNVIKEVKVDGNLAKLSETEAKTYEYTMTNKNTMPSIYVLMEDKNAEIALNNILYEKKEITKTITFDSKEIKITMNVKAENGDTDTYYLIIKALPDNTNIDEIIIGDYKAEPVPYTDKYEIRVPKDMTSYDITIKLEDILAKVGIEDKTESIGTVTETVTKQEGVTKVNIHVTAQDGTEKDYVLEIYEMSDNTELSFVKVDGNFVEINEEGKYIVKVVSTKETVLADVTAADDKAKVGILYDGISNILTDEELTISEDSNEFTITVTAEDGTIKTYPLIIEKMSSNADMVEVYVDGTKIEPDEEGNYIACIGNESDADVKVIADENATISINGESEELGESTRNVSVTEEEKEVSVRIVAEDGTEKTHTILLKKYSSDTSLLEIAADGVDSDRITQTGEDTYQIVIAQGINEIDLTATTTSKVANVKIEENDYEVNTTTKKISVPNDENTVKVTVKAENGTEKEYTITIIKKYELTIESIKVNEIVATEKDGEYIAFVERDEDTSKVVIKTTNPKSIITIKDVITGEGTVEFNTDTSGEEQIITFIVKSPLDDDEVEYTLVIKKKSNDTSLEWVKSGEIVATEEEDRYILKVPDNADTYVIDAKANNEYAKVKIEDNVGSETSQDTYTLDLTGLKEKEITVYVTAQNGETKEHKVLVQKNSNDSTIKTLKVGEQEVTAVDNIYKVFVKAGTENVDLYIETTNSGALIKIDAEEAETKHILNRTENISGSAKTMTITVTAEDGSTSRYTLEIGIESDDTGLEWAKVKENKEDSTEIVAVEKDDGYYVTAPAGLDEIIIKARTNNEYAKVSINGEEAVVHEGEILYALPKDQKTVEVTITVTAQNGVDTAEYKLQIETVSKDTEIAKITVDGEVVNEYNAETKTYDIVVDYEKDESVVYVETANEYATVRIAAEDAELHTTTKTVSIANTENVIDITVIAEDGTVEVRHLQIRKLSRETSIIRMVVNGKNAEKAEDNDLSYSATIVESEENAITQIFTADSRTKIKIGEVVIADPTGEGYTEAILGRRTITLQITAEAEDTRFTENYTLTINVISDNKDLKTLTVAGVTLGEEDFDAETNTYTAFIPAGSTNAVISAETESAYATTRIEETEGTNIISYTQVVDTDPETVVLIVTAEDNTSRAYTIMMKQISTDNSLIEVKNNGVVVNEEEDGSYNITVPEDTEKLELSAKATNEYATVSIDGEAKEKEIQVKEINLEGKVTTVVITVTAQNGDEAEYTVTITKVSSSNELEWIKVDGNLAKLNEETGEYEALIPSSTAEAEVIAQAINDYATIGIEEASAVKTLTTMVDTTDEVTKVMITVTSENGEIETYNLSIRKISGDTSAIIYVEDIAVIPDEDGNYIAKVVDTKLEANVKVVTNNEFATAEIEGFDPDTAKTEHSVVLDGDTTNVQITITAQDGSSETITLTIIKASDDVSIKELKLGEKEVTTYDADTKTYSIYIPKESNLNDLYVKTTSEKATIVVEDVKGTGTIQKNNIDTSTDLTKVTIIVKSEYGTTENYTLNIIKESSDASILELKVNDEELLVEPYEVTVKNSDTEAKIYVKTTDENATVKIGEGTTAKGEKTENVVFPDGAEEMTVIVTVVSQDGKTTKEYPIKITKQSNNTAIKQILVNGEEVEINENLEAIIKNVDTSEIKVVLENGKAYVAIDENEKEQGSTTKNVSTPVTTVRTITVTAEDGTVKEYQITLIKKFTITGKITDEFVTDKHIAMITVFQTADKRDEDDITDPREVIYEIQTQEDGTFELILDSGTYDIRITKPGYLTHRITNINLSGNKGIELETKALIAGDVKKSGDINIGDLTSINDHYMKDVTKYPEYDLNGDGKIDILDRKLVTKNFGKKMITEIWVNPDVEDEEEKLPGEDIEIPEESVEAAELPTKSSKSVKAPDFILPISCKYTITSEFGERIHPISKEVHKHAGMDLRGEHHTEIMAVREGEVTFAGVQNGYGNCIEIKHEINGKTIYSFYAHLSKINVEKGETVKQGVVIGLEGGEPGVDPNHGTSTGHHLHFEIRTAPGAKNAVSPTEYIKF